MDYQKMSKEELVKTIVSLEKENSNLRSVVNNCSNSQSADYKYDSDIPFEIKRNLDCGNLVIPYFHFPHAYMLTNMQGEVLFACPNMLKLFGYDEDYSYLRKSIFNYLAPERLERAKQFFKDQKIYKEELVGVKANGEQFYIEINGNIIKDPEGKPTNIVFLIRDVDQRKKNEERLHVLSNAIEQSPVAVVITDVLGNIEYVNPKAIETTGYDLQELIGQNPRVLKSGETSYEEYKKMWDTIKDGKIWNGFFHNKKKNGELYWESSTIAPVLNDRGDIVRFVAIKEDVSNRKEYEKEILDLNINLEKKIEERTSELTEINKNFLNEINDRKKSEEQLFWNKSLLELMSSSTPLGFLVIDNNTDNILYFNKKFCEIWDIEQFMPQMSSGVIKNRDLRSHYAKCLNNPEAFFESIKPLYDMSNRVVISDEIPFVGNRTIRRFSTQIRGANDMYYGRFYMFEDITQSKLAEEKLRIASFEAEKANEAKSEFLSRMSHELRTPLNSILGFAQLLEMTELNDVQKKGTNHILNSGKHLLNLINDVLDISKIEAGRLVLYAETISIKEIVMETIEILQPMAEKASVKIKFGCNIEEDLVKTDRQSLKQIMVNILNNAIKYNKPKGSVFINVENNKELEKTIISITDTGIGISNSNLQRIFDPFERVGADLTSIEGTGLGLSVVKKLINAVGSEIYVESELGKGSKFWFELPKGKNYYHFENLVQNKNEILPTKKGKKTVLYIEDNASSIELLEEIILNSCQEVKLYNETKGKNAISVATKIKPDVILLDLNLPDVHGTEILKNIRNNDSLKELPIIVVSADALPRQIDEVMNLGATNYITKPFDVKQVIEIFNSL